jgi:hypothetical protein
MLVIRRWKSKVSLWNRSFNFALPCRMDEVKKSPSHAGLIIRLIAFVLCAVALSWVVFFILPDKPTSASNGSKPVSHAERVHDWREMAQQAMLSECSNLVGFHRVLEGASILSNRSDDPTNWDGWAQAEIVNKVGGIERTNLRFKFSVYSDKVLALPETGYERIVRWRREAPEEVRRSTTGLFGSSNITRMEVSGDYSSEDPAEWRARAKVELANTAGGIQYTSLPFRFAGSGDFIIADWIKARWEEDMANIRKRHAENVAKIDSETELSLELLKRARDENFRRIDAGTVDGPRTWTFQKGAKWLGTFVRYQGTNAIVITRISDGREYVVPLAYLSEYDNYYLDLAEKTKRPVWP